MKHLSILIILSLLTIHISFAQSKALSEQIAMDKKEAADIGYKLLDSGGFGTSNDWYMQFDINEFYAGTEYLMVFYIEGCSYCEPGMYFQFTATGNVKEYFPDYKRAGDALRAIYNFEQESYVKGNLVVFSKTDTKYYTYGMLFSR